MSETPVVTSPETPAAPTMALGDLSDTQRSEWLKTGNLPTAEPETSPEPPAPSPTGDESRPDGETKPPVETAAEPKKVAKPRDDVNARLGQLAEQRNTERARAEKAERELAELRAGRTAPTPESVTPPVTAPKPQTHLELVKKYQSEPDWPTLDQAIAAGFDDPYQAVTNAQNLYITEKLQTEREQTAQLTSQRRTIESKVEQTWTDGKAKYPDWDPSPLKDLQGPSVGVFAEVVFSSDLSVELLYHFSKHPAEARALAAMEPLAAAKSIGKLESQLSTSAPSRVATPTKTVSSAPEPPQTLGSRHTPNAGDEVEAALASGDTGRYIELVNQRELADRKAGRR